MVKKLRKRLEILKKSFVIFIVFFMISVNVVSGIVPDNGNGIDTKEMVQRPEFINHTWFIETLNQGAGMGFGRSYQHENFFYNFTVMSNSSDSVVFDFSGDWEYTPTIGDMTLTPGESFAGNFTYIGEYATSGTMFMDFEFKVETGGNATVIFEAVLWDTYIYKMGTTGYIIIGSLSGVFIIFVVYFLFFYNKGKKSPIL